MSHLNVAQAGSSSTRPRVRLTRDASAFLTNYARTVTAYPTKAEKQEILTTLHTIPGNESFTVQKLSSWFARHRNPSGDAHTLVLLDDETILFPKLTPTHLQQLRVLYKKRTDPAEGIITFWAERIKADRAEVAAWIRYQQEKAKENDAGATPESPEIPLQQLLGDISDSPSVSPTLTEFPRPHLPTPAKSPSTSPQTRMPSLPPIAVKVEEARQCLSPVSSLDAPSLFKPKQANYVHPTEHRSALDGLPPLSRLVPVARLPPVSTSVPNALFHVGGQPRWHDSNRTLTASIREGLRPDATPSEQPPRTADEFARQFERVEKMIESFMHKYDSGQLERLGWDASLGETAPS